MDRIQDLLVLHRTVGMRTDGEVVALCIKGVGKKGGGEWCTGGALGCAGERTGSMLHGAACAWVARCQVVRAAPYGG